MEINIFIDDELIDSPWRWVIDARTGEKKILFVSREVFKLIDEGQMPEELAEELTNFGSNGGSLI